MIALQKSMIKLLSFADFITILNAIFGFLAILVLFTDITYKIHLSFSFILLGLLADGLDGIIARRYTKSKIGDFLEPMADMTSMIIAPAVFIFFIYLNQITGYQIRQIYILVALILFLFFGILRLASFNVLKEKQKYIGLPASASAILLMVMAYLNLNIILILFASIIIGALMASNIVFPKPGLRINIIASILILLSIILGNSYYNIAPIMLGLAILIFTFFSPFYVKIVKKGQ